MNNTILNNDFYLKGYELALENSYRLQCVSNLSANEGNYGIACSLNILAAEEAVKANFILVKHFNSDSEIEDFENIFKNHKTKHKHLKEFASVRDVQISNFREDLEIFDEFIKIFNELPERFKSTTESSLKSINEIKHLISEYDKNKITYLQIAKWADKANDQKNNGFYVDLRNDTLGILQMIFLKKSFNEKKNTLRQLLTSQN